MNLYNSFRHSSVEELEEGKWEAITSINDTFHEMKVKVLIQRQEGYKLMDTSSYIILEARGEMLRCPHDLCRNTLELLPGLEMLKLSPPVRKKVMEKVAGNMGCRQLADLVMEAIRAFIQAEFYKRGRPFSDPLERRRHFKKDIGNNCYLYSYIK